MTTLSINAVINSIDAFFATPAPQACANAVARPAADLAPPQSAAQTRTEDME